MLPPNLYARVHLLLCAKAHETAGAARTRSSLRPLIGEGGKFRQTSGRTCREMATSYLCRMGRAQRNPSLTNAGVDGFRFALPILRNSRPWLGVTAQHRAFRYAESRHSEGLMDAPCIYRHDLRSNGRRLNFAAQQSQGIGPLLTGNGNWAGLSILVHLACKLRNPRPHAPKK